MKFVIGFDTSAYESSNRRTWEVQLNNDICVALNGLFWEYKTIKGVEDRFNFMRGYRSGISRSSAHNVFVLKDERYGAQTIEKKLPGLCTGYVSFEKVANELETNGLVRISFERFYDGRAISKSLGLNKCFVYIKKVED